MEGSFRDPMERRFGGLVFDGPPARASRLACQWITNGPQTGIEYVLDNRFSGQVLVDWSSVGVMPDTSSVSSLNLALSALVAQFSLPDELVIRGQLSTGSLDPLRGLLGMLYDIRSFCDETPYKAVPRVKVTTKGAVEPEGFKADDSSALVLLSGGFDSTFATVVLKEAGYKLHALHVRANRHVESAEESAARYVASELGIPLSVVHLRFPDQERIGRYYSRSFGEYPFYNSVPHGRDLPLAVLATILARLWGFGAVVLGHEKESRQKAIRDGDRRIFRHDVESAYGLRLTQQYVDRTLGRGVELFSPIAGVSLYRIRKTMLLRFPKLVAGLQSCFWGTRCEKCLKCLSAYTMQRHLRRQVVRFDQNPFADPDDEDMHIFATPDRPSEFLGYGPLMHYAMVQILERGRVLPGDFWLRQFERKGLAAIQGQWQKIEQVCLSHIKTAEVPSRVYEHIEDLLA